jgi:hypothetical protein
MSPLTQAVPSGPDSLLLKIGDHRSLPAADTAGEGGQEEAEADGIEHLMMLPDAL